jgi:hypothetical protein
MIRAQQSTLNQQTNLAILNIRQSEITYYTNLNIAFGTQAALIGGFTYAVFLNDHTGGDGDVFQNNVQDIYWVVAAATMCCSVFIILTTMFLHVFGPGLALNGPVGSMVKASEGMRIEQIPVIKAFILMVILFSISTILLFWVIMNYYSAAGATAVYFIGAYYWYKYCERIYLRFYWKADAAKWREDSLSDIEAPLPLPLASNADGTTTNPIQNGHTNHMHLPLQHMNSSSSNNNNNNNNLRNDSPTTVAVHRPHDISMEGYILKKGSYVECDISKEPWERRYFVLLYNAELLMYKTRQEYHSNPQHPLHNRPLYLRDFLMSTCTAETDDTEKPQCSRHHFQITLKPIDNSHSGRSHTVQNLLLRVDTKEELFAWFNVMKELVPENVRAKGE